MKKNSVFVSIVTISALVAAILLYTTERGKNEDLGMAIGAGIFASIFAVLGIAALCADVARRVCVRERVGARRMAARSRVHRLSPS